MRPLKPQITSTASVVKVHLLSTAINFFVVLSTAYHSNFPLLTTFWYFWKMPHIDYAYSWNDLHCSQRLSLSRTQPNLQRGRILEAGRLSGVLVRERTACLHSQGMRSPDLPLRPQPESAAQRMLPILLSKRKWVLLQLGRPSELSWNRVCVRVQKWHRSNRSTAASC